MKLSQLITTRRSKRLLTRGLPLTRGLLLSVCALINGCSLANSPVNDAASTTLQGRVQIHYPLARAEIHIKDAKGQHWQTHTDSQGNYRFALPAEAEWPLRLAAVSESGRIEDCTRNDIYRPICLVSFITHASGVGIANINPLSDRIASDLAAAANLIGPQQLWQQERLPFNADELTRALQHALNAQQKSFSEALMQLGIADPSAFNPASADAIAAGKLDELFSLIKHNRTYDNNTGATGHTTLSDARFKPLVGLFHGGEYEPFNLAAARAQAKKIANARTRIFIVGDSTSAMYEDLRAPRMGWGEAFANALASLDDVAVIVGSRAGRSSRDFVNGRWFAQMEGLIQPGDYVFINHGHNDQNCDSARPIRGAADVQNLCTYPNNEQGQPQFPGRQVWLSFEQSLIRYIAAASVRGAHPIMFTPTTRILNAARQQQLPVSENHYTAPAAGKTYAFTGNYSETIRQLAAREQLPLIDLERASIAFANQLSGNQWHDYWLVVDPAVNAFYQPDVGGSPSRPDGTHFQARGANVMAQEVLRLIREGAKSDASTAPGSLGALAKLIQTSD